jgi:15-cis-phytoene synthase
MVVDKTIFSIFRKGSRTYFYSSLFFPMHIRQEVFILYGFVRKTDNYVDVIPQNKEGFYEFKEKYYQAKNGKQNGDIVIDSFVSLAKRKGFEDEWVEAFLHSMELDLIKKSYETLDEVLEYIYGSAEVIGLMMAKIIGLPKESFEHAKYLGRAMQYINFIRDIAEDLELGRVYFPQEDLRNNGLENLTYKHVRERPEKFTAFLQTQLDRYCQWQEKAEEGYHFIPKRYLISIKTASEMYHWTAEQITHHPFIVYDVKVKPMISKIILTVFSNLINTMGTKFSTSFCQQASTDDKKSLK